MGPFVMGPFVMGPFVMGPLVMCPYVYVKHILCKKGRNQQKRSLCVMLFIHAFDTFLTF
jgi:hypothetical protein